MRLKGGQLRFLIGSAAAWTALRGVSWWIGGLFVAIGLTGMIVLAATLFNLITDLVGGVRVTVLEEEVIEREPGERPSLLRRRSRKSGGSK